MSIENRVKKLERDNGPKYSLAERLDYALNNPNYKPTEDKLSGMSDDELRGVMKLGGKKGLSARLELALRTK